MAIRTEKFDVRVYKQGELDSLCGIYCLATIKAYETKEDDPDIKNLLTKTRANNGIDIDCLQSICESELGKPWKKIQGNPHGLEQLQYGIALVGTKFAPYQEYGFYMHYVALFRHTDGVLYIADPHPRKKNIAKMDGTLFRKEWGREGNTVWAPDQPGCWPGPFSAIGRPTG